MLLGVMTFYCETPRRRRPNRVASVLWARGGFRIGWYPHMKKSMMSVVELFWVKVDKGGEDECWEWKAYRNEDGYGKFTDYRSGPTKLYRAHRYSWRLAFGPIPDGLLVLHKCDNPSCCNPKHLFLGTNQTNMDDMKRKGRSLVGEQNPNAKLNWQAVRVIRWAVATGVTQAKLARLYGLSPSNIADIVHDRAWRERSVA